MPVKAIHTSSLEDFVLAKTSSINSYHSFSLVDLISIDSGINIAFPVFNVLNDYFDEIREKRVDVELSDVEYIKYRYKPKLLAYDIYGNTELAFLILEMNDIFNIHDFDLRNIKLVRKATLVDMLTNIKSSETKFIEKYNSVAENSLLNG